MAPARRPSGHIPLTSHSHTAFPSFPKHPGPPGFPTSPKKVSSNALSFLRAISHLPFLKLLPDHKYEGTMDPRLPGHAVGQQWACHTYAQAEDLGQEDLQGLLSHTRPQQGKWITAWQTGLALAEPHGSVGRALCNLMVLLLSVGRHRFKVSFCTFGKECRPTCCLCWAHPQW